MARIRYRDGAVQPETCVNCWEVEARIDEYVKSERGRARVRIAVDS